MKNALKQNFNRYAEEQELLLIDSQECVEVLRQIDWKNDNIEQISNNISCDFPLIFRRGILCQAIKMCRSDGNYHKQEKLTAAQAAEILGIDRNMLVSLESLAGGEELIDRLQLSLLEI